MAETENTIKCEHNLDMIPRLHRLRRVPTRYRSVLPLPVMQRYRCLVIGSANGILTLAVSDPLDIRVLVSLCYLTGQEIFPVFVDATRLRLLLQRLERDVQMKESPLRRSYRMWAFHPRVLHSFLSLIALPQADTRPH